VGRHASNGLDNLAFIVRNDFYPPQVDAE